MSITKESCNHLFLVLWGRHGHNRMYAIGVDHHYVVSSNPAKGEVYNIM